MISSKTMPNPQIILLTDTVLNGELGSTRYMGSYVLASQLQQAGYRVVVVDYFTQHPNFFEYIKNFLSPDLLFIGISSTFLAPSRTLQDPRKNRTDSLDRFYSGELWCGNGEELAEWLMRLKNLLKNYTQGAKIILGGTKAQFAIWRAQYYSAVDYVCLGSADKTIVKAARQLSEGQRVTTKNLNGIQVLDNSEDLQDKNCPTTVWTQNFAVQKGESLPLEIARGCVFNCKFCHYDKKESYKKNIESLRQELIHNYENFGTDTYHFCDDCFNDHPKKVEAYCNIFLSLPFKMEWTAYSRVDVAVKFPETMDLMIQSGARGLYFGLESFNHEVALKAGKGTPTEKVKDFLLNFRKKHKENCLVEGSFIVGLPGETKESQLQTRDWILNNQVFDFLSIGPLGLMPYVARFDKILFDYAEYSRNPEKFGFRKIDHQKRYWEHDTFNSVEASQMATEIMSIWKQKHSYQKIRSIWLYPHMKTLGFTKEEIFEMARGEGESATPNLQEACDRFSRFKSQYWDHLARENRSAGEYKINSISQFLY